MELIIIIFFNCQIFEGHKISDCVFDSRAAVFTTNGAQPAALMENHSRASVGLHLSC